MKKILYPVLVGCMTIPSFAFLNGRNDRQNLQQNMKNENLRNQSFRRNSQLTRKGPNVRKLDGTGPLGEGPKTGRGLGNCDIQDVKKDQNENNIRSFRGRSLNRLKSTNEG